MTNDLISRKAAIDAIKNNIMSTKEGFYEPCEVFEVLSELPSAQPESAKDTNVPINDYIRRQAAIDTLRMDISIIPFAKAREYVRATIEEIYNRLEALPSAQPEQRWILLSEHKPEISGLYLVSGKFRFGSPFVCPCSYIGGDIGRFDTEWECDLIAWMPLPEPYREEGGAE